MASLTPTMEEFIAGVSPFNQLPQDALAKLSAQWQTVRYRLGETILMRDKIPAHITIIYSGQARLLGYDSRSQKEVTVTKLEPGAILGWTSLIREVYTETAIASSEVDCLVLPTPEFYALLQEYPDLAQEFQQKCALIEVFELLGAELERRADGATNLKELTQQAYKEAVVCQVPPTNPAELDSDWLWFISGGQASADLPVGTLIDNQATLDHLNQISSGKVRVVGIPKSIFVSEIVKVAPSHTATILYARDHLTPPESLPSVEPRKDKHKKLKYPLVRGKGDEKATMACFQMLSEYFRIPFHREVIRTVVVNQQKTGNLSLPFCAAVADLMGLQTQLVGVAAKSLIKLPTPALIRWEDNFAILYEISPQKIVFAAPESGIKTLKLATFIDIWGESGQVLLLKEGINTPQNKFNISWFIPALSRYRRVLIEVLIASFFVQLFGLVNPLMTQVIIDQVIGGNSLDTLHVLGVLLIFVAIFEGFLGSVRTYLFTDTTNRIDLTLASQVIDHLLRLPMSYFGKRPVGELTTRVTELEKIRSFLTGTALTVVLDAIFSVIYVVVMVIYSPQLSVVALLVIPLFILLTLIFSPILRRMLRTKAERYAATNSYLVEVLSGIETVKSQNIELRSRMTWQEQYGRYISAGFKAVKLSTIAGSLSDFLNKFSSLLVLWVGAYLVLKNKLTLGELIAFRIISGYVTGPLLRLSQLWQNFQETALSLERLGDILNHAQESPPEARNNLPLPEIKGQVQYENISFRFANSGPLQLSQINLDISASSFVGIVGQSGSGKSTLTKLLPRFYEPLGGRILIDGYDISKIELYSLRRQLGIVPQNPLLFDGTIHENIALNNPEATTEAIFAAAKIACAHDFIMDLPHGYNTQVGERGSALSGGQRQRIAIARAVLQNPRLLILDEATSALDYETEQQLCSNLAEKFKDRTVFFITHRLSTIKEADLIIFMAKGIIEEMGTHEELMALKGRYYCLYN